MYASPALRILRAAVFAAVCLTLSAAGHQLAAGSAPPVRADGIGFLAVLVLGYLLSARERSLPGIGGVMLATQGGLHLAFNAAQAPARRLTATSMPMGMHATRMMAHPHPTAHVAAAHTAAALLASLWLRRGEAALWSLLRRAAMLVPGLVAWWGAREGRLPALVHVVVPSGRTTGQRPLRQALLRHAVSRRGPPLPDPYRVLFVSRSPRRSAHPCPTTADHSRRPISTESPVSLTHTTLRRALRRTTLVTALATAGLLTAAGSAFAHVTVHPGSYPKGATDGTLTFRVPNEEDNADTTQVQVFPPTDHPIPSVLVTPEPGWTAHVTTTKLKNPIKTDDGTINEAVSQITWTKGSIQPGQYQDFTVAFGQLPDDTDQLAFKALQTYSDGKVVRWIEEPKVGQAEPENPAPVLKLTKAADEAAPSASGAPKASASAAGDSTTRGLGIAGLIAGVLGIGTAAVALYRSRSARP
ncbi:hypothetical protein GCM10010341_75550 [Streptomyces noursei]|nr:hypothetical protein GCM10010341_75550 [Streptomyces noursei]